MSQLHLGKNPTLADIQQYVADMEKERGFTKVTLLETYLLLVEEVGELAKCIRKSSHTSMRTDTARKYQDDAAEEIADIIMVLTAVANRLDVDIEQAFRDKEELNKQRVWA
jgi:NTP pyrophosphatase (non-canonical NTP hydrolase)